MIYGTEVETGVAQSGKEAEHLRAFCDGLGRVEGLGQE